MFRERLVVSLLSRRPLVISNIRADVETDPGLRDFEANFLRLLEKVTDGKAELRIICSYFSRHECSFQVAV